jgi:transcriptional regulator with XRE-family HTH domain
LSASIASGFGRVLRKLRKETGLTQEELGLEAGLQRKFISSLELGEKEPSLATVFKLASALKIKPGKLVTLVDSELNDN